MALERGFLTFKQAWPIRIWRSLFEQCAHSSVILQKKSVCKVCQMRWNATTNANAWGRCMGGHFGSVEELNGAVAQTWVCRNWAEVANCTSSFNAAANLSRSGRLISTNGRLAEVWCPVPKLPKGAMATASSGGTRWVDQWRTTPGSRHGTGGNIRTHFLSQAVIASITYNM